MPPWFPDLTALDFFLWGYSKERVYMNKPQTIQRLKDNIRVEIGNLQPETLCVVTENILERARLCQRKIGRWDICGLLYFIGKQKNFHELYFLEKKEKEKERNEKVSEVI